jgi:hypothetical protein
MSPAMQAEIKSGDHGDEKAWEYHKPYTSTTRGSQEADVNRAPCKHVTWIGEAYGKKRTDGSVYGYERQYSIPEAAILFNEGGYNSTVLCLLCADEARAAHNT